MNILDKLDAIEEIAVHAVAIGQVCDLKDRFADVYDEIQTLEAKIKELESEREWVSVEDRLPEINGDYLCYVTFKGDYGYTEDEIKTTICSYIRFGKQWSLVGASGRYFKGIKVHKWMPLPKSPKGE